MNESTRSKILCSHLLLHHHLQLLLCHPRLEIETDGIGIAPEAIQKRHVIRWLGLVYGEMKRPEGERGIDKKRPIKEPLRLSVLECVFRGTRTCLVARCCPGHTLDDRQSATHTTCRMDSHRLPNPKAGNLRSFLRFPSDVNHRVKSNVSGLGNTSGSREMALVEPV